MGQAAITRAVATVGVTLGVSALALLIETVKEKFRKKPERPPPPPPPDNFNISQDDLIRDAQIRLKMDVLNNYNYALCGPRGTGKVAKIAAC